MFVVSSVVTVSWLVSWLVSRHFFVLTFFFKFVATNKINVTIELSQLQFICVAIGFAFCLVLCCDIVF